MEVSKISSLLALSLVTSPVVLGAKENSTLTQPHASSIRSSIRKMGYLLGAAPTLTPRGMYVGELQEKWQFPSDHLPVGITYDDLNIGSWNVLDADYMSWVFQNSQGLSRSQIVDEHVFIDGSKLTVRDVHVADMVVEMLTHPSHPRSAMALQECNEVFIEHLKTKLPENYRVMNHHGNAMIVDQNVFDVVYAKDVYGIFSKDRRSVQEVLLRRKENQEELKLINVHLPGDPAGPARFEFGKYLAKSQSDMPTIAMGDMNFNEIEMRDACFQLPNFTIYTPYCTNISVAMSDNPFTSKAIDHFIVNSPKNLSINSAEEVWIGLDKTYQLLNGCSYQKTFN